jgi:hypothetical protein
MLREDVQMTMKKGLTLSEMLAEVRVQVEEIIKARPR